MKKIFVALATIATFTSCTKDLGTLQNVSTREFKTDQTYELALKQQTFTANSLEDAVNVALKAVPNSAFLRNTKITSKGKKVTLVTDVWSASKRKEKNKDLNLERYKKPKGQSSRDRMSAVGSTNLKVGMQVMWNHPKAGQGQGMIAKISGNFAQIDKVINSDGKSGKSQRLPLEILKPLKKK